MDRPIQIIASAFLASSLTGCSSGGKLESPTPNTYAPLVAVTAAELEGNWGLASFRNEADRMRTEGEAKSACSNPYSIRKGNSGGVVMHLADQTQPQELYLKSAESGQVFLGPKGDPGMQQDRLIVSFADGVLVARWVDAGTAERFGTMVFVRCSAT